MSGTRMTGCAHAARPLVVFGGRVLDVLKVGDEGYPEGEDGHHDDDSKDLRRPEVRPPCTCRTHRRRRHSPGSTADVSRRHLRMTSLDPLADSSHTPSVRRGYVALLIGGVLLPLAACTSGTPCDSPKCGGPATLPQFAVTWLSTVSECLCRAIGLRSRSAG